jgi:hypothetical protein
MNPRLDTSYLFKVKKRLPTVRVMHDPSRKDTHTCSYSDRRRLGLHLDDPMPINPNFIPMGEEHRTEEMP